MDGVVNATGCDDGSLLSGVDTLLSQESSINRTATFELPMDVVSAFCVCVKTVVDGEVIDSIDTLATISFNYIGEFKVGIAAKTKDMQTFDQITDNYILVKVYFCDDDNEELVSQDLKQGQDFKICVKEDEDLSYQIDALKNVVCSYDNPNPSKIMDLATELCVYTDFWKDLYGNKECSANDILELQFDEANRLRVGENCLKNDGGNAGMCVCGPS